MLDPETLAHRFYRREGELLIEFAATEGVVRSTVLRGFTLRRYWLNPERPPKVGSCLDEIVKPPSR